MINAIPLLRKVSLGTLYYIYVELIAQAFNVPHICLTLRARVGKMLISHEKSRNSINS